MSEYISGKSIIIVAPAVTARPVKNAVSIVIVNGVRILVMGRFIEKVAGIEGGYIRLVIVGIVPDCKTEEGSLS